jgi:uncharacterized protein YfaS (alpha-2-macroglobulin family)
MKKRVVALVIALGCFIGLVTIFIEITEMDSFLRRTVLRAAPPYPKERLHSWPTPVVTSSSPEQGQSDVLPRSPITLTILAPPIVVDTEPSQQVQFARDLDQVTITFSHPMDEASVESNLSIEPRIRALELAWAEETLTIRGDFRPETTYQVSIAKGAQEAAQGLPMAEDFTWAFTVVERRPDLAMAWPGHVGMLEAEASFQLPLTILNLSRIDLALYALDGPTFVALQGLSTGDWEQYHPEGNPIRDWSVSSQAKADQEISQEVKVDPLPPGLYFLAVGGPEGAQISQLLSVSRSALVLKRAPEQALVWAVALADGSPAADSEVIIYEKAQAQSGLVTRVLATGRTDREGVFKISLPQETGPLLLVIAQREDDVAVCAEEWSAAVAPEAVEGLSRPADTMLHSPSFILYAYTDRPVYQPGQEVHFKAIVRRDDDGRYSLLPTDTMVSVVVTDEAGRKVYRETLQLSPCGSVSPGRSSRSRRGGQRWRRGAREPFSGGKAAPTGLRRRRDHRSAQLRAVS